MGENENVKPEPEKKPEVKPQSPIDAGLSTVQKEVMKKKSKPKPQAAKPKPKPAKPKAKVKTKPKGKKKGVKTSPKASKVKRHKVKPGKARHLINFKVSEAERKRIERNAERISSGSISQFLRLIATAVWDKKALLKLI